MPVQKLKPAQTTTEREEAWFRANGVEHTTLTPVIEFAEFHRKAGFKNDPKATSNFLFWARGSGGLADAFPTWEYTQEGNKPRIVSPDGSHAISFSHGDAATGDPHAHPTTRNPAGVTTDEFATCNTGYLFAPPPPEDCDLDDSRCLNYILLVAPFKGEIRYELSLPLEIKGGRVTKWGPRLYFGAIQTTALPVTPDEPEDETDVPVEPRA